MRLAKGLALWMAFAWLAPGAARAVSISLVAPSAVAENSSFDVEIHLLGAPELNDSFGPPSVRAFDLDLAYDDSLLAFEGVIFAAFLGEPYQTIVSSVASGGIVDLKEVSLLGSAGLDSLQPQDFLLATLRFQATVAGEVLFQLTQRDVSDASGARLPVAGTSTASVEVVPEPATALLLAGGLLALAGRRIRRA